MILVGPQPIHRLLKPSRRGGPDSKPCHKPPKFISSASASFLGRGSAIPRYSKSSIQAPFSNNSSSDPVSDPEWTVASPVASAPLVAQLRNPAPLVASFESGPTTVPERVRRTLDDPGATLNEETPGLAKSDARMVPARFRAGLPLTYFFVVGSAWASCRECDRV